MMVGAVPAMVPWELTRARPAGAPAPGCTGVAAGRSFSPAAGEERPRTAACRRSPRHMRCGMLPAAAGPPPHRWPPLRAPALQDPLRAEQAPQHTHKKKGRVRRSAPTVVTSAICRAAVRVQECGAAVARGRAVAAVGDGGGERAALGPAMGTKRGLMV